MTNLREHIIATINNPLDNVLFDNYDLMKSCISVEDKEDIDIIDLWFKGIVSSLFYNPNKYLLVLRTEKVHNISQFFQLILPQKEWYNDSSYYSLYPNVYQSLIVDMSDFSRKEAKDIVKSDGFVINNVTRKSDKRLASICYTCERHHDSLYGRKNIIVLHVKGIDWDKLMSIDKKLLWTEIYHKFI